PNQFSLLYLVLNGIDLNLGFQTSIKGIDNCDFYWYKPIWARISKRTSKISRSLCEWKLYLIQKLGFQIRLKGFNYSYRGERVHV
ncbi:hypothetical protein GIB67_032721, partial [Kingdonia uniflora]